MGIDSTFSFLQILRLFLPPRPEKSITPIKLINSHFGICESVEERGNIEKLCCKHTQEHCSSANQGTYSKPHPTVKRKIKESKTKVERLILYPLKTQFYTHPQLDLHLSLETQPRINPPAPTPPPKKQPRYLAPGNHAVTNNHPNRYSGHCNRAAIAGHDGSFQPQTPTPRPFFRRCLRWGRWYSWCYSWRTCRHCWCCYWSRCFYRCSSSCQHSPDIAARTKNNNIHINLYISPFSSSWLEKNPQKKSYVITFYL